MGPPGRPVGHRDSSQRVFAGLRQRPSEDRRFRRQDRWRQQQLALRVGRRVVGLVLFGDCSHRALQPFRRVRSRPLETRHLRRHQRGQSGRRLLGVRRHALAGSGCGARRTHVPVRCGDGVRRDCRRHAPLRGTRRRRPLARAVFVGRRGLAKPHPRQRRPEPALAPRDGLRQRARQDGRLRRVHLDRLQQRAVGVGRRHLAESHPQLRRPLGPARLTAWRTTARGAGW